MHRISEGFSAGAVTARGQVSGAHASSLSTWGSDPYQTSVDGPATAQFSGVIEPPRPELSRIVANCFAGAVSQGQDAAIDGRWLPEGRSIVVFLIEKGSARRGSVAMPGRHASLCFGGPRLRWTSLPSGTIAFAAVLLRAGTLRSHGGALGSLPGPDGLVELEALWGASARTLLHAMVEAPTTVGRLDLLQEAVHERYVRPRRYDDLCLSAAALIDTSGGTLRTAQLEARMGYSARTVRQRFETWAGISPKQYSRIGRLHRCVLLARRNARPDWTSLADEAGYADQSHLVHEFQDLIGKSPGVFMSETQAAERHGAFVDQTGRAVSPLTAGLALLPREVKRPT